ncbi:3'(2'),5'-bisphosphate nucleotidase CysQ [Devosia sp.]|uniref:3'(2'),5'-bisphosphate nucleotidase CysQ n=1 Tax=Devosia sp. TaxID=1871048 RepID=UPI0035B220C1
MSDRLLDLMVTAAIGAAEVINEVYDGAFDAEAKADGSPVTVADQRAEALILEALKAHPVPFLGEESVAAGHVPHLEDSFFVVDPLDGTKEFIKRNGEFTVNIALTEHRRPRRGVVLAPATGEVFFGGPDGAFSARLDGRQLADLRPIRVSDPDRPLRIVASRSHGHAATRLLCEAMRVAEDVSVGSSLKFCLLAAGKAELYPRFTPTSEWDTAAGQAVLEAAGGVVVDMDGQPLRCGHAERRFLNPYFVAASSLELAQRAVTEMRRLTA